MNRYEDELVLFQSTTSETPFVHVATQKPKFYFGFEPEGQTYPFHTNF
jgi:hypothetical protein